MVFARVVHMDSDAVVRAVVATVALSQMEEASAVHSGAEVQLKVGDSYSAVAGLAPVAGCCWALGAEYIVENPRLYFVFFVAQLIALRPNCQRRAMQH